MSPPRFHVTTSRGPPLSCLLLLSHEEKIASPALSVLSFSSFPLLLILSVLFLLLSLFYWTGPGLFSLSFRRQRLGEYSCFLQIHPSDLFCRLAECGVPPAADRIVFSHIPHPRRAASSPEGLRHHHPSTSSSIERCHTSSPPSPLSTRPSHDSYLLNLEFSRVTPPHSARC